MMKQLLLVEDDSFIVDIYATYFKKEGYGVDVANDGQMALEKIKNHLPDVLILDIGLPGMDGWELLRILREDPKTKELKVIIVSNNNQDEYADQIAHYKVIQYFLKIETTPEEIGKKVKEILNQAT